jgi:ketosteroid isomerase-like protein
VSDANLQVVQNVYDAFALRDPITIQANFSEDVVVRQFGDVPWGGEYHGHEGMLTFLLKLVENIDSEVTLLERFAAGDKVVQTGRTRGKVKANGNPFDIPIVHVWTIRDGLAIRYEAYIDVPGMQKALNS